MGTDWLTGCMCCCGVVWGRAAAEVVVVCLWHTVPYPTLHPTPPQEGEEEAAKRSNHVQRKLEKRKPTAKVDLHVEEQFSTGRLYGV